jgi:hypothetical protein
MTNLTGDRRGTLLEPGDPVVYFHDEETALSATVLRVVGQEFLIQLDPTAHRATTGVTLRTATSDFEFCGQEPFEVRGLRLEFSGEWGDEAELDEAETA